MPRPTQAATHEFERNAMSGFPMLFINVLWLLGCLYLFFSSIARVQYHPGQFPWGVPIAAVFFLAGLIALFGYFTLQPNEARVQILFGSYKGTVRKSGFHWANPFYSRSRGGQGSSTAENNAKPLSNRDLLRSVRADLTPAKPTKLSLRAHNFNSETLKVNDKRGNPVEIAAVVVWRVADTAQAVFDVEDYQSYVQVQSESAIRSIASRFAYDHGVEHEATLRGSADEVAQALQDELQVRLAKAGVTVEEARLTHLAYAPEIASVMLRPSAGRSHHRGPPAHRAGLGGHGRKRADPAGAQWGGEARRGAPCRDGQQPAGRALRQWRGHTRHQCRHAVRLIVPPAERKAFLLRVPADLWKDLEKMGRRRSAQHQCADRVPAAPVRGRPQGRRAQPRPGQGPGLSSRSRLPPGWAV
jgi:regulator of protease activity HflC (stomatin/prohibitin superfamily)